MFPEVVVTSKAEGSLLEFWLALVSGDTNTLQMLLDDPQDPVHPNTVFDTSDVEEWKNYRYNTTALRIWSMTYEEEFTCPLYVTANRGYTDCLQLLLKEGADVDFAPGGESALHGACENSQVECVKILLRYGANPNAGSQEGTQPLHRCKTPQSYHCAKLLIQYGAHVNSQSEDEEETPLHVAARHGLHELVDLYLRYGASVNKKDLNGLTPLCAACNQPQSPQDIERYYQVCQNLIQNGANIRERDHDQQSPLHLACKNANPHVVDMLLDHGAEVNTMSYSGNTALQNILQVTAYKLENHPELIVRSLLNHGAVRVWPGSLIKVLRYCCSSPRTVEVLLNSYTKVKVTEEWAQVVPEEEQKKHLSFFQSVFSLSDSPRSLQHLCRCAVRSYLEGRLSQTIPRLPLPRYLLQFLQLKFEDILY
ncbi:ankyrin repeat and SOCS box protein 10 isoform 2-T2 [Discoglossus pictus]